jgi:hypothetical protein
MISVFRRMGSIERDNVRMMERDKEKLRTGERRRGCESRRERVDSRDKRKIIIENCRRRTRVVRKRVSEGSKERARRTRRVEKANGGKLLRWSKRKE